jgi:hypothetical protein
VKSLDVLFNNPPFLSELKEFLKFHIDELNGLHPNIISQFLRKLFDRARQDGTTADQKREALWIMKLIN